MRTAILRKARRNVSNVALRHGERRGVAMLMQQPIGAAVQEQPELVGFPAVARGAVGPGVELVLLDHVRMAGQ